MRLLALAVLPALALGAAVAPQAQGEIGEVAEVSESAVVVPDVPAVAHQPEVPASSNENANTDKEEEAAPAAPVVADPEPEPEPQPETKAKTCQFDSCHDVWSQCFSTVEKCNDDGSVSVTITASSSCKADGKGLSWWGAQESNDQCNKVDGSGSTTITVPAGQGYYFVQVHDGQIHGQHPPTNNACAGKGYGGGCGDHFGNGNAQSGWCKLQVDVDTDCKKEPLVCKSDTAWCGTGKDTTENKFGKQWGFYHKDQSASGLSIYAGQRPVSGATVSYTASGSNTVFTFNNFPIGLRFRAVDYAVKIHGGDDINEFPRATNGNPQPGHFACRHVMDAGVEMPSSFSVSCSGVSDIWAIHLDVEQCQ